MKNYMIKVQYDGTRYNGWQRQGNTPNTIQEKFENVLSIMCGTPVEIFSSGRTDRGVHAFGQIANFRCNVDMTEKEIRDYLNHYLPEDIKVISTREADERFHSRLNAVSKTYMYSFATDKPDVFLRKYVYCPDKIPDAQKMCSAALKFIGTHDFRGFSSLGKTKKSTIRTINALDIEEKDGLINIIINGNGFLYNMVRIIAGTLYEIGIGSMNETAIDLVFETKSRENAGITLPPCGLKLMEVYY